MQASINKSVIVFGVQKLEGRRISLEAIEQARVQAVRWKQQCKGPGKRLSLLWLLAMHILIKHK